MDPITIGLLAGGGLGLVKTGMDQQAAARQRKQEAEIARWSPWTGMQPQRVQTPNMLGNVMQGATAGGLTGSSFKGMGGGGADAAAAETAAAPQTGAAPAPYGLAQQPMTQQQYMQQQMPYLWPQMNPRSNY